MSPAASAPHGRRDPSESFSIGEVIAQLRTDFPDVTISKIRFLEAEGLVEPRRSPSGYRKFEVGDVERLRFVLTAQRDHYLPLRVIKEHLDAVDRGDEATLSGVRRLSPVPQVVSDADGYPAAETFRPGDRDARFDRSQLKDIAGIDDELLGQLESYGLISARGGGQEYDGESVAIAKVAGELAAYGLEPRHLRMFRTTADREVGLIEQLVAPLERQRGADARARAEETGRELAASLLRLHALLVKATLR